MIIQLSDAERDRFLKPVHGRGGFQSLLRKIQKQINGNQLAASEEDIEKLVRYSFEYGQGGYQERTKPTAKRAR